MRYHPFSSPVALLACFGLAISTVLAGGSARTAFGKQSPFQAGELPEGKLKTGLLALDPQAHDKAMKWLHTFDFDKTDAAEHLRVDKGGGVFIVCPDDEGKCDGHSHGTDKPGATPESSGETGNIAPALDETTEAPPVEYAAVLVSSPPAYHSKPNATRRIYLDFNGAIVSGTAWNTSAGVTSWNVKVWSQDADITTFNDSEQAWMKRVWQRVAEDYAPFDVDVTTDVAYDPDNYTGNKDYVGWLLICDTTDNNGVALPHAGSGGVAYVGVFGNSTYSPTYQPAWVTSTNGGGDESVIAEAASHEMGHNMGLSHDGTSTLGYYGGHGTGDISWGPLMGTGYWRNVSQWSKGEYYDANQLQDDLAIISARVPYRSDDHGGTSGTATALTVTGGTTISSTTPENDPANANPANKGVIERNTDVDVFSFYTGTGTVLLNAKPWIQPAGTRGGNLDILLELYNEAGVLVTSNNSASLTNASISTSLTQGYYYLHVRNTGTGTPLVSPPSGYTVYGSIGQYFISGTIVNANPPLVLSGITPASGFANTTVTVDVSGTGMSTSTAFKLTKSGQADIAASSVVAAGSVFRCQFNLTGAATGAWNVIATNPNLETSTLTDAFTVVGAIWTESFDGAVAGWSSEATTGSNSWSLTTAQSQSPTTSYFAAGPSTKSTTNLVSPSISIPTGSTNLQLKFWHSYNLQNARDAGKLEFSINNGAWFDVTASGSGAAFASNGYTTTISATGSPSSRNEFAGQSAWSGSSGGFIESIVNLTDSVKYSGKNLRLRWRIATDGSTASSGWYVDSISLIGGGDLTNQPPVIASAATSTSTETQIDPDSTIYQIIRGSSASLSVSAADDAGESALTYTWTVSNGPGAPVVFSSNGTNASKTTTAGFETTGDYRISVSVRDAQGLAVSSSVNLRVVQTASALEVTPSVATLALGATQVFNATLLDQFSAAMASQPSSFTWSASGGGSISAAGLFSATSAGGPFVVTATSGSFSNTSNVTVTPAPATVTLGSLSQSYDGNAKSATVTTNPPGLAVALTYDGSPTPPVNAGTYQVAATITDPNYQGSATGSLVIGKATATIELADLLTTYDGNPKPATATTTPPGLTVTLTYDGSPTPPVNAGTFQVAATITDPNYQGSATGSLVIGKATATIELADLLTTYDGNPKPAKATTTPPGLTVILTYDGSATPPVNAGTYQVAATITDPNYQGSATGSLVIGKATATIDLADLQATYDGNPKPAKATTTPPGLTVTLTYDGSATPPVNAGTFQVAATITDPNYQGSATGLLVIGKATATIELADLLTTYDGSPKPATATTTPPGLTVTLTYNGSPTAPTEAGSYTVAASVIDPNYDGTATGTLVIAPANDWTSWCGEHFNESEIIEGLAAETADADADGRQNLAEYALGTDPRQFTPPLIATRDENGLTLTFTRPPNLPGVTYAAESSDALGNWTPVLLEIVEEGDPETLQARDPLTQGDPSKRFLRLRFERQ